MRCPSLAALAFSSLRKTPARQEPNPVGFGIRAHKGPRGRDPPGIPAPFIHGVKTSHKLPAIALSTLRETVARLGGWTIYKEVSRGARRVEPAGNTQDDLGGGHPEPMTPGGLGRDGSRGRRGTRRDRPGSNGGAVVPAFAVQTPPLIWPESRAFSIRNHDSGRGSIKVPLISSADHFNRVEGYTPANAPTTPIRIRRGEVRRTRTTTRRPSEVRNVRRGGRSSRQRGTTRPRPSMTSLHPIRPSAPARHNAFARDFRRRWPLTSRGTSTPRRPEEGVGVGSPRDPRSGATPHPTQEAGQA